MSRRKPDAVSEEASLLLPKFDYHLDAYQFT